MLRPARQLDVPCPCRVAAGKRVVPRRNAGSIQLPTPRTFGGETLDTGGASAPRISCSSVSLSVKPRRIFGVHPLRCSVPVARQRRRGGGGQRRPLRLVRRQTR